jgi:hypothetical protein
MLAILKCSVVFSLIVVTDGPLEELLKANSHIACRVHAVPLIRTCHAMPLPCSDSAVSFVKVRLLARNIRTASPTV